MRRLSLCDYELVALKAILTIDPHAGKLKPRSVQLMTIARESVQHALFAFLSNRLQPSEAASRFGNLLLLVASFSVGH